MPRFLLFLPMIFFQAACTSGSLPRIAAQPAAETPVSVLFQLTQHRADGSTQQSLLLEENTRETLRYIQTDALGTPLARQILVRSEGKWRNDGFLPPNRAASRLFTALLAHKNPQVLPEVSAEKNAAGTETVYRRAGGRELWRVRETAPDTAEICFNGGDCWTIRFIQKIGH